LSLRRRLGDCGNPRESKDQMDRHVASLLVERTSGACMSPVSFLSEAGAALRSGLLMNTLCLSLRRRPADCVNPRDVRDRMDGHVAHSTSSASRACRGAAPLPYNTRLSLRRRLADCGNPREGKDQMDRHVASLLAMTGGGRELVMDGHVARAMGSGAPSDDKRSLQKGCAHRGTTHACHCEGG